MSSRRNTHFNLCINHIGSPSVRGCHNAHSLFCYPVKEDGDIDDQFPSWFNLSEERSALLREVSVIFWDEFISSDRSLFEAVLQAMEMQWERPRHYVFICAGDFAQVGQFILHHYYFGSCSISSLIVELHFLSFRYSPS